MEGGYVCFFCDGVEFKEGIVGDAVDRDIVFCVLCFGWGGGREVMVKIVEIMEPYRKYLVLMYSYLHHAFKHNS